ncbi:unnamed protein product [Urochloa decumbens]|uniref:GDSL esterase/lipase n=1 Tax=Urochloa decumbens TaxID=240449 RepID=A0ABC9ECP4_9POAL
MATRANVSVVAALCGLLLVLLAATEAEASRHRRLVPAVFVLGDSTVDVGNNNRLNITAAGRANYPHYGVDFPGSSVPTGRFSNGRPAGSGPWLQPQPTGVPLPRDGEGRQVSHVQRHQLRVRRVRPLGRHRPSPVWRGANKTASLLRNSIFVVSVGSNDMFEYSASRGDDYAFLTGLALYEMGARKLSVISVPPLGCLPSQRLRRLQQLGTQGCFDPLNDLSLRSYPMLAAMLEELARELPGMAYSLADAYAMVAFVLENPRTQAWSFTELEAACCGAGPFGAAYPCNQTAPVCGDRDGHLFWDANHPTQAVSLIAAQTIFAGNGTFVNPINVRDLALLVL